MDYYGPSIFYQLDVSWIVLIAAGIFLFISSIVMIILLCLLWRRHQTSRQVNTNTQMPVQIDDRPSGSYETQKMEIFVPQDEDDATQRNFGEFHASITPQNGIQQMHPFYQRTNKAYF